MDYFQRDEPSDDELYKQDGFSSEGIDSETETTLLGYVHYNSVTLNSQPPPQPEEVQQTDNDLSEGEIASETDSDGTLNNDTTFSNLKEVTMSINPTQPVVEISRELFIAKSVQPSLRARYFTEEKSSIKCFNCDKTGHIAIDCPQKKNRCSQCKDMNHLISECPWTICSCCMQYGHSERVCTFKRDGQRCGFCNSEKHSSKGCRVFWREYIDLKHPQNSERLPKWCYNCGEMNHFGDSCKFLFYAHTTSFSGTDAEDSTLKGKVRINPHFHAFFTKPILSDIAPETAAVPQDPRHRSYRNNNDRQSNHNNRLGFASNIDGRYNSNHPRNDGYGSRANLARRSEAPYYPRDNHRNYNSRDSSGYQDRSFRGTPPHRNGSKFGLSDYRSQNFK